MSTIEWTNQTWNPTTGCDLLSPGCDHCYAKTLSRRLMLMGQPKYSNDFALTLHPDTLDLPRTWKKPQMVFVNSMSDLFHVDVPLDFIQLVFKTMRETPQHTYQILTKRSGRLLSLSEQIEWPANVWMGVSVESAAYRSRVDHLRKTGAVLRFLSLEPLLGPLGVLNLDGIGWVICGGESGPGARSPQADWVRSVRDQCAVAGVPFFFKQWGAWLPGGQDGAKREAPLVQILNSSDEPIHVGKKTAGALLDGREHKEWPK